MVLKMMMVMVVYLGKNSLYSMCNNNTSSTVSKAKILANPELFIKSGSDINLTCVALQAPAPPSFIYWYRGGRVINYSQRGGISVITEPQTRTSKLIISHATPSDSGNYTCSPSSAGKCFVVDYNSSVYHLTKLVECLVGFQAIVNISHDCSVLIP